MLSYFSFSIVNLELRSQPSLSNVKYWFLLLSLWVVSFPHTIYQCLKVVQKWYSRTLHKTHQGRWRIKGSLQWWEILVLHWSSLGVTLWHVPQENSILSELLEGHTCTHVHCNPRSSQVPRARIKFMGTMDFISIPTSIFSCCVIETGIGYLLDIHVWHSPHALQPSFAILLAPSWTWFLFASGVYNCFSFFLVFSPSRSHVVSSFTSLRYFVQRSPFQKKFP